MEHSDGPEQRSVMLFARKLRTLTPTETWDAHRREEVVLVDVRQRPEWRSGVIAGALLIPLSELARRIDELPQGKTVGFVCRSGHRSTLAARRARKQDIDVLSVKGGMIAWEEAGLPTSPPPRHESGQAVNRSATHAIERLPRRSATCMVPRPLPNQPGLLTVDATWGKIAPIQLAPGVRTVGELEVIEHIAAGLPMVDTRLEHFYLEGTIPSSRNIPHDQIEQSIGALDRGADTVFFCNGPQCAATPDAIRILLEAGYPPERILLLPRRDPRLDDARPADRAPE